MTKWIALGCAGLLLLAGLVFGLLVVRNYNALVKLDQDVQGQWGQVQSSYQRRADLVPNLVETVKGAANFEQSTLTAIVEARAKVGQISGDALKNAVNDPAAMKNFEQAQGGLSSALSRLLVVVEQYPELKANANYRDLQAQLEGTENRINVERMRYNDSAKAFNTKRNSFPTVIIAGFFGSKFAEKAFFQATPGADTAPKVKF